MALTLNRFIINCEAPQKSVDNKISLANPTIKLSNIFSLYNEIYLKHIFIQSIYHSSLLTSYNYSYQIFHTNAQYKSI